MRRTRQGSYPTSVRSHGAEGQRPFALRPDSKRKGGHVVAAEERWRELRAQGAQIDAAARAAPGRRHLEAVREGTSAAKPLGLVWVMTPSYSITAAGVKEALEGKADVCAEIRPARTR